MGLAFLAAAIVVAATTWFHLHNFAGRMLADLFLGAFGSAAWTVPLLLGLLAWRFLRHPDRNAQTGRMVIGWTCLLLGGLGLVHIAAGTPQPSAGESAMRSGAGLIGFFVSAPLVAGLTPWIAAPLLALVSGFGLLVITGTPVHRVPDRLAELRGFTQRAGDGGLDEDDGPAGRSRAPRGAGPLPRGGRKRPPAIEAGDHHRPYDTPILGDGPAGKAAGTGRLRRGAAAPQPADAAAPAAEDPDESLLDALGFGPAGAPARARAGPSRGTRPPGGVRTAPPGLTRPPTTLRGPGPGRAADPVRVGRVQLHPAADGAAQAGQRAQGADPGQRRGGPGADRGAGAVRGGRAGHRVQARAHRDQVRDRAGPRGEGRAGHRS